MWLGTEDGTIHVYNCSDNIRDTERNFGPGRDEKKTYCPARQRFFFNLCIDGGGGGDSIQHFKELFSQPKLDIFRGFYGYDLGDTKSVDTPVS